MDNFHFIDIKPTIDRTEAASIKDAIFRRAREKAQQLTEEKSDNYTSIFVFIKFVCANRTTHTSNNIRSWQN